MRFAREKKRLSHKKKGITKVIFYFSFFIAIILLSTLLILNIYRDDIAGMLLLEVNEIQSGELEFEELSFNPFAQFPQMSLHLKNTTYFGVADSSNADSAQQILELDDIYVAINMVKLISGEIDISKIKIEGGSLRIVTNEDSTTNIGLAFRKPNDLENLDYTSSKIMHQSITSDQKKDSDKNSALDERKSILEINNLTIEDLVIHFDNKILERNSSLLINKISASFDHHDKFNKIELFSDISIKYIMENKKSLVEDLTFIFSTDFEYNGLEKVLSINSSRINIEGAEFNVIGQVDLKKEHYDLSIELTDKKFSLFSLIMKDDILNYNREKLMKGSYILDCKVLGNMNDKYPLIEGDLYVKNVNLTMPKNGKSIDNLNLDLNFTSGGKQDLSEAIIRIDNFNAKLPDGKTHGSLSIKNLQKPYINFNWFVKTDLAGYDEIFKMEDFQNLAGTVTFEIIAESEVDSNYIDNLDENSQLEILFEDVSLRIPDILSLDKVNGQIKKENNKIIFDSLSVICEKSDLLLNGSFENILYLLFDIEKEIKGNLVLESNYFDLPRLFAFDPSIGRSFNHILKDLKLKFSAHSTTSEALNFDSFPAIDFAIDILETKSDDFPDLKIIESDISFYDDSSGFNIKYYPLNIYSANGLVNLNGAYNGSSWKPYALSGFAKSKDLELLNLLNQFEMEQDTSSVFNWIVNGDFNYKIEFPKDSLDFKTLQISDANLLLYQYSQNDTIILNSLTVGLSDIYYDLNVDSNPLATLSTNGIILSENLKTSHFNFKNVNFDLKVTNGLYEIETKSNALFRADGYGLILLNPWANIPVFKLKYSVAKFKIEDLLANFVEQPNLSGDMSMNIDIEMKGIDWENLRSNLNGKIFSEGSDLLFQGLDADLLLKKLERSQNFTLVDVGAVLLAGPVGLAVTKGAAVTSLLVSNSGEVTHIQKFVSDWDIKNGLVMIDDVALSTQKNRVAAKGSLNLASETLDIIFAVLNPDGSASLTQDISGDINNPAVGEIKVVSTLLSPVTNLYNSVFQIKGDLFYEGKVKPPE